MLTTQAPPTCAPVTHRAAAAFARTAGTEPQPAFWTTMAQVDAAKAGKPLYVSDRQGVEFCVPVHFGRPQPADDFRD